MEFATNDVELDGEVRREQLHGAEYLVADVVAVREMVLNGGFLPFSAIQRSAPGWNGVPVTLHHPEDAEGNFISANLPEVHESHVFGRLFNARAEEDVRGLVGELWIHLDVAQSLGDEAVQTIEQLENQEALEVSTGYFMEPMPQPGTHEGESYEQVQTNLLPDHLAALPGGKGACSVEDGCGAPRAQVWIPDLSDLDTDGTGTNAGLFQTVRHAGHVLVGNGGDCGCGCSGPSGGDANTKPDDTTHMDDKIIEFLEETHGVEIEDPDEPTEEELAALEAAQADDGGDDDPPTDPAGQGADPDPDDPPEWAAELQQEFRELKEQHEQERQEERDELIDHITDHSDKWTEEMLADVDSVEALETIADDVTPQAGGAFGSGVNYAGRGASEPSAEENSEWDDYEPVVTDNTVQEEAD